VTAISRQKKRSFPGCTKNNFVIDLYIHDVRFSPGQLLYTTRRKIMESREISEILYQENSEYRNLSDQHRSLEIRLQELSSHLYLSDSEKLEEITLKKKKLILKDRMQELMNKHGM
jgi:uncharacterized protein YdcH (DUF465 family)